MRRRRRHTPRAEERRCFAVGLYRRDRHSRALHARCKAACSRGLTAMRRARPRPRHRARSACLPPRQFARRTLSPFRALARRRRERQLSELCASVSGTRPLNGEASLLETPVGTKDGGALALRMCVCRRAAQRAGALTRGRAAQSAAAGLPRRAAGADGACDARSSAQGCRDAPCALRCRADAFRRAPAQVTAPVQHPWVDPATRRVDYSSCAPRARAAAAACSG